MPDVFAVSVLVTQAVPGDRSCQTRPRGRSASHSQRGRLAMPVVHRGGSGRRSCDHVRVVVIWGGRPPKERGGGSDADEAALEAAAVVAARGD